MANPLAYLGAAFNARPAGTPVPPNWLILGAIAALAIFHSPLWLAIGLGFEMTYLMAMCASARFRAGVDARARGAGGDDWLERRAALMAALDPAARREQEAVEALAREIAARDGADRGVLARLAWIHLRLLGGRRDLRALLADAAGERAGLAGRIADLAARRAAAAGALADSLAGQQELLERRQALLAEAQDRLAYVDAEIERLVLQVRLLRDQSLTAEAGDGAGRVLSELSAGLDATGAWMAASRPLLGAMDDLAATPSPRLLDAAAAKA